ncbi:hypothetical protein KKG31_09090 [Patescibacteria group bacterium]|nr:hypothetical protein [Patescibacteria group bacterium]
MPAATAKSMMTPAGPLEPPLRRMAFQAGSAKRKNRGAWFALAIFGIIMVVIMIVLGGSYVKNNLWPKLESRLAEHNAIKFDEDDGIANTEPVENPTATVEDEIPVEEPAPELPVVEDPIDEQIEEIIIETPEPAATPEPTCSTGNCPKLQQQQPDPPPPAPVSCQNFNIVKLDGADWMLMSECSDGISRKCAHIMSNIDGATGAYQVCDVYDPSVTPAPEEPASEPGPDPDPICNSGTITDPDDSGIKWFVFGDCNDHYTRRCAYTAENWDTATNNYRECELIAP